MMAQDTLIEPQTQTSRDLPKWTGYLSCDDLPFRIFIDCLLHQQYEKLILDGSPTEEQLGELWLKLYSEYHKLAGASSADAIVAQLWRRDTILHKIACVKKVLELFAEHPNEQVAAIIRKYGYPIPVSDDPDEQTSIINRIVAQLKGEEYEAKQVQQILDSLKGDDVTKSTFTKQLVAISRHNKYHISINDITTAEYCEYVRTFREYAEQINNLTGHAQGD